MAEDLTAWLESNGIYEKLPQILQHLKSKDEVYIVTTKQVLCLSAVFSAQLHYCWRGHKFDLDVWAFTHLRPLIGPHDSDSPYLLCCRLDSLRLC